MKAFRIFSFLILTSLITTFAQARLTDDQVVFKTTDGKIEVSTKPGFHLNAEAPANATFDGLEALFKPLPKTEKLFVFQIPTKAKKAKLSFYVCDDKKTACEQHLKEISVSTGAAVEKPKAELDVISPKDSKKINFVNTADKPTLMIFSAPWCPACIRMQTEVYPKKDIQAVFKKVQLEKINIDLPASLELSEKFHVKAIPTYVLVNQKGEEISRWLDFQPADSFSKQLEHKIKSSITLADLEQKANLGDAAAISAMGMNAYNALNCEEAIKWFSQSKKIVDLNYKLASEISCAEEKNQSVETNVTDYLNALQKGITMTLSQMDQYRWTSDWIEKLKEKKALSEEAKEKAKITISNFKQLLKDPEKLEEAFSESTMGDVGRFDKEEVLLMKSRLQGALDQPKEKADTLKALVDLILKKKITTEKPGEMLLAIAYLREAGDKEAVTKFYKELLAKSPKTYVYHEKYGRYLFKEKNFEAALSEVDTALKFAEGNEPQLYLLKARILNEKNDKKMAASVLDQAMGFDQINHAKYKRTVAQIAQLKKEISNEIK